MVPSLQPLNREMCIRDSLTTDIILDREHAAIMEHCEAVTGRRMPNPAKRWARSTSRRGMPNHGRPIRDLMNEYEATVAATSINMINFSASPWS